ncbi:MAG TPA: DUF4124 domain-containing protein [Oleiagrimonas sp.]|nr:DUF4124 domain-containing protein [Oleiagrimonas sp.]
MRLILRTLSIILIGLAASVQAGQPQNTTFRYRWVDATGLPHYSDSLSIKAIKYGYDVLDARGMVVRRVAGEMSSAERKLADAKAAHAASTREAALDQQEQDRQMLMAYPTEASYAAAQQARLDSLDDHIHTTQMNLQSQEQNLAQLLDRAADYSSQGETVPHALTQRIAEQSQTVAAQRQLLKQQKAGKDALGKQVESNIAHYRTLSAKQQVQYGQ